MIRRPRPRTRRPRVVQRFAPGHYYSPLPDLRELQDTSRNSQVWPGESPETPGIDWRDAEQLALCRDVFTSQRRLTFAAVGGDDPTAYFPDNGQFPPLDAWILEAVLRHHAPRNMIEVGSGFSTLVSARVGREALPTPLKLTCIEPYPRDFLRQGVPGVSAVVEQKVQDVPLPTFTDLRDGDILFVDTSHVVKTGGDVAWIFHQILPRLASGVLVHLHDIFLPRDYPELWVMEGWNWNEQYLLHSFLQFNDAFEVLFAARWMIEHHPDALLAAFPGWADYEMQGASGFWMRRRAGSTPGDPDAAAGDRPPQRDDA